MRPFLRHAAAFLSLQIGILVALNLFYMGVIQKDHYMLAWRDKTRRLEALSGPRLILSGGSSPAFGLDSKALAERSGRGVVNLGLHGGLGLDFMLRQIERSARPGDLVVLGPEYEVLEGGEEWFHGTTLLDLLSVAPEAASLLSWRQVAVMLDRGLEVIAKRPRILLVMLISELPEVAPDQRRSGFNEYGDLAAPRGRPAGERVADQPGVGVQPAAVAVAVPRLNRFVKHVRAQGGEVCLVPPPVPASAYRDYGARLDAVWKVIADGVDACLLAEKPLVYPDRLFVATNGYHLNAPDGVARRTEDVLERLEARYPRVSIRARSR